MTVDTRLLAEAIAVLEGANFSEGQTKAIIRAIDAVVAMDEETVQRFENTSGEVTRMLVKTMELASATSRLTTALSERLDELERRIEELETLI